MTSARPSQFLRRTLVERATARYAFAILLVAAAIEGRAVLQPVTGPRSPFLLLFGAVLVTSQLAGIRAGIFATALGVILGAYNAVMEAGFAWSQAVWQALLFAAVCALAIYIASEVSKLAARAQDLLESAPDAFFLTDRAGRCAEVNRAAYRMLGYESDELIGTPLAELVAPEDAPRFEADQARLRAPERSLTSEYRLRRKDGTSLIAEVSANRVAGGRYQAFARDITERKRSEDERQVFVWLLDSASDFIGIADPDGKPTYINPAGRRMIGVSPELDVGGTEFPQYYPPDERGFARDVIMSSLFERGHWAGETYFRRWDTDRRIPVSTENFIVRDTSGTRRLGFATIARDISKARQIAEERELLLERERAARHESEAAYARLRESEERFRLTIEDAPIGMALVCPDGQFVRVNHALCRLVGYTAAELEQMRFQDITHPDDLETDVTQTHRLARGEIPHYQLEKRYVRRDGGVVTVLLSVSVLRGPDGEAAYFIAQIEDITERKRGEQALRRSEAWFSGIISISADAIIAIDGDQRIILFNDGAERIFGYQRAELLGGPLDVLLPERFRDQHRRDLAKFQAGPDTSRRMGDGTSVIAGLRKSGEEFPAEAAISKLQVDGATTMTVALRDATAQKQVERKQRFLAEAGTVLSSSLDYEQTLTAVGELAVRELADCCIIELAQGDRRVRRRAVCADPRQRALVEPLEQLGSDADRSRLARVVWSTRQPLVIERVGAADLEAFAPSPEQLRILGALAPRSLMAVPLSIRGQLLGVLVFVLSAGQPRSYTTRDLPFATALADRAALAIENGRLYQASVQASELRDQVLGVVAHDLRNPLALIQLQASALEALPGQPERRNPKPRLAILRAADRMSHIIQDLLDITSIEAGQLHLQREPLPATRLLVDAVEAERSMAAAASLELRLDLEPELPEVWGDPNRLYQVLENVIGNAIKFTPAGGRIIIGAAARANDVMFWVTDTGPGIDPEGLRHVFDRFWQAKKGTGHGAGLGLPISRGIVEAHGGRIWVHSTPGRGTTFFFTVPRGPAAHPAQAEHQAPQPG
ncbi:MAG: PAS domain S-box protein [Kofleriaceae bacterium]